jgi:exopolyphosphatase/guanosine-5'-triphosphate,3'-diphosphate pyrophosphatase
MIPRIAVLDLGTNTFNLLIAEPGQSSFTVLYKAETFVHIGEEGLERIGDKAFQRALEQIRKYSEVIKEYEVSKIIGFGTAAMRRASNGGDLEKAIKSICPMELRRISGDEEAELIFLGVRQAITLDWQPVLIMDIGGGSTECIVADKDRIFWKESFPVGASVLKQKFHHSEPISVAEVQALKKYLDEELAPLLQQLDLLKPKKLIGASGSFDTFAAIVSHACDHISSAEENSFQITASQFQTVKQKIVRGNLEERLTIPGMISFRAPMIVVAAILTEFVMEKSGFHDVTQSAYALKEGAMWKMISAKDNWL